MTLLLMGAGKPTDVAALPPVNSVAPVASGTLNTGDTISVTNGTWTGTPTSYTYQLQADNGGDLNFANVVGQTTNSLPIPYGQVGNNLRWNVTATNAAGSATQASNVIGPVTSTTHTQQYDGPTSTFWNSPITGTVQVECTGAGANGDGSGNGGGGGGYGRTNALSVTSGNTYAMTIDGSGSTAFASVLAVVGTAGSGTAGGSGTGVDESRSGGNGGALAGGGGGAGSSGANGNNGVDGDGLGSPGSGGSSSSGGSGGNGSVISNGGDGGAPGGGGGGALGGSGGAGGAGRILITWTG